MQHLHSTPEPNHSPRQSPVRAIVAAALAPILAIAAGCTTEPAAGTAAAPPELHTQPHTFEPSSGATVDAELGWIEVPENRNDPNSRTIRLSFVRFPSTSPSPAEPIIYLAGGPGGSGIETARSRRFEQFMALTKVADVIALDQRGVGQSNSIPFCKREDQAEGAPAVELTRDAMVEYSTRDLARCFDWWISQGIAIDSYNTVESAADIEDLRRALGVEKVNLWGISYGSHLGLAMLKYHPDSVRRAVLAGIEGLDQTVKLPAQTDDLIDRIQTLIDQDAKASAVYPDLEALMRRVHAKLNETPAHVTVRDPSGNPVSVTFDGFGVQLFAGQMMSDPGGIASVPLTYLALDNGQYERFATFVYRALGNDASGFAGMPQAMDIASGISPERLAVVETQAKDAVLGDALNFPMPQMRAARPQLDLGETFRQPFRSDVPVLFISGTLDGRTYPAEAREVVKGFANGVHMIVENGGHNIFEADPRIQEAVVAFFSGEPVETAIRFDPPTFATP